MTIYNLFISVDIFYELKKLIESKNTFQPKIVITDRKYRRLEKVRLSPQYLHFTIVTTLVYLYVYNLKHIGWKYKIRRSN